MSNRNFDSSIITKRLADKAVAKNILSSCKVQPQTSNVSSSVINQVQLGNSVVVSRGPTCSTIDNGCPCPIRGGPNISIYGTPLWAAYFDTTATDRGLSVITDSNNNIYMTGFYAASSSQNVRNGSDINNYIISGITLPATTGEAAFLIKYNSLGIVQWATFLNGTGNDRGLSLDVDSSDNIYLSGFYISTSSVIVRDVSGNSQTASLITLPASGATSNAFLIKYNSSGIAQWATYLGNNDAADEGKAVKVDSLNNIYLGGYYNSTSTVSIQDVSGIGQTPSPTITVLPSTTNRAGFLIKYNSSGIAQWAIYLNGNGDDEIIDMAIDSLDNVYITGTYRNSTTPLTNVINSKDNNYENSGIQLVNPVNLGYYLIKYNSSGKAEWATCQTAALTFGNAIAIDSNDNIYTIGNTGTEQSIRNAITKESSYSDSSIRIGGGSAAFLIKYNSSGAPQWATTIDGTNSDGAGSIVIDSYNNIYFTGFYNSTSTLNLINSWTGNKNGTPSYIILPSSSNQTVFLVKYNSSGIVQWGTYLEGSNNDNGLGLAIDSLNNVYLSGFYRQTAGNVSVYIPNTPGTITKPSNTFISPGIILPSTGGESAFLIKYSYP
jgi:hypothetical protein